MCLPYIAIFHNLFWVMFVYDDGIQSWLDLVGIRDGHVRLRAHTWYEQSSIFALAYCAIAWTVYWLGIAMRHPKAKQA